MFFESICLPLQKKMPNLLFYLSNLASHSICALCVTCKHFYWEILIFPSFLPTIGIWNAFKPATHVLRGGGLLRLTTQAWSNENVLQHFFDRRKTYLQKIQHKKSINFHWQVLKTQKFTLEKVLNDKNVRFFVLRRKYKCVFI